MILTGVKLLCNRMSNKGLAGRPPVCQLNVAHNRIDVAPFCPGKILIKTLLRRHQTIPVHTLELFQQTIDSFVSFLSSTIIYHFSNKLSYCKFCGLRRIDTSYNNYGYGTNVDEISAAVTVLTGPKNQGKNKFWESFIKGNRLSPLTWQDFE